MVAMGSTEMDKTTILTQAVAQLRAELAKTISERDAALQEAYLVMADNERLRTHTAA